MRDYSVSAGTRQATTTRHHAHSTGVAKLHQYQVKSAGTTWLAALTTRVVWWGLALVGMLCMAWLVSLILIANAHQLLPVTRSQTVVLVDPSPGSQSDIVVVQLAPIGKKVLVYAIPTAQTSELFSTYGEYPVGSIYPLLKIENKDEHYIAATLGAGLGLVVDEVLPVPGLATWLQHKQLLEQPASTLKKIAGSVWRNQQGISVPWSTQLSWWLYLQRVDITWVASQVADTNDRFQLEPAFASNQKCAVAVVNTTKVRGLARKISQALENSGLVVIRTAAEQSIETDSVVLYDPTQTECTSMLPYIEQALPSHKAAQPDTALANRFRATIVVVLGQDLFAANPETK